MGYSKFKYGDTTFTSQTGGPNLVLLGDVISLTKGDVQDLPDTLMRLDLDAYGSFDVEQKETVSVASGTKLKDTTSAYDPFLDDSQIVTVSVTGGVEAVPTLALKKDNEITDADKSGYNLVLVGGPVANALTAELVTAAKSAVDWETSAGDIEIVNDAFVTGKAAIIVAGKNREATAAAADALAAQL
jgi:S-layer protein (TIGR01564 family)